MFVENNVDPETIVRATQRLDDGVQGLLVEAGRMVVVADAYQEFFGIDIKALILLYRKYGRGVLEVNLNELVKISQQGLLPHKQDGGNEATPAELTTEEDHVVITCVEKKPKYSAKTAGKRLKSTPITAKKTVPFPRPTATTQGRASTVGKQPPTSIIAAKKSMPLVSATGQRRVIAHICSSRCTNYMRKQAFINHAALNHKDKIPSEVHEVKCCNEFYTKEVAYLDHQWEQHSEILPAEDNSGGTAPHEDLATPYSPSSTPTSESDAGDY
ncbi:hypothetical protein N0V90_011756 [Kalmusia sp. IMI 367209]|nr:hypothetical protein N0V90_011756 [Kalmusia sp. IMI 367209]